MNSLDIQIQRLEEEKERCLISMRNTEIGSFAYEVARLQYQNAEYMKEEYIKNPNYVRVDTEEGKGVKAWENDCEEKHKYDYRWIKDKKEREELIKKNRGVSK